MKKLAYVSADDWCAVYVEGELLTQGHSIATWEWLDFLGRGPFEVDRTHDDSDHAYKVAEDLGEFPETYQEFLDYTFD